MEKGSELMPCPFCKNREEIMMVKEDVITYWVVCRACSARGPVAPTRKMAQYYWEDRG